jgi:hypothetical protein
MEKIRTRAHNKRGVQLVQAVRQTRPASLAVPQNLELRDMPQLPVSPKVRGAKGNASRWPKASLLTFIKKGGWFCEHCRRVVTLALDLDEPARCPGCKHPTCYYHEAVALLANIP